MLKVTQLCSKTANQLTLRNQALWCLFLLKGLYWASTSIHCSTNASASATFIRTVCSVRSRPSGTWWPIYAWQLCCMYLIFLTVQPKLLCNSNDKLLPTIFAPNIPVSPLSAVYLLWLASCWFLPCAIATLKWQVSDWWVRFCQPQ